MAKQFDAAEVAKHNSSKSCWVILYGNVYDVTDFIPSHPGGAKAILALAGKDATEEYDPIHPPGTLEEYLKPEAKLGAVDPATLSKAKPSAAASPASEKDDDAPVPMDHLMNLEDIEIEATKRLAKKAWAYYYSGSDDMVTKSHNSTAYRDVILRPRIFVDCTECDTSTTLLGHKVNTPVYISPTAMGRLAHPDGELGVARAAAKYGALQLVSNNASLTPEQIISEAKAGQVFGWQLYVQNRRDRSEEMLRRINKLKDFYKTVIVTLDAPVPGKREIDEKANLDRSFAVEAGAKTGEEKLPGGGGVGQQLFFGTASDLTWRTTLPWLAKHTDLPLVLKGIHTYEDAYLASKFAPQVKAIILSNHGGRALDTASPPVHVLMEIRKYCPEVFDKIEVWVDGGIKRGTDVVKALCLGAKAVGIGRAPLYGLGAGGQAGVERTFEILQREISTCMRLLGANKISDLGSRFINTRRLEREIYDGPSGIDQDKEGQWGLWSPPKAKL